MSLLLLVRHGQASFGAEDYDQLSPTGYAQARLLGAAIAARGSLPTAVVHGSLRRHEQTFRAVAEGAGSALPEPEQDAGWDEFDHEQVLFASRPQFRDREVLMRELAASDHPGRAFQSLFVEATDRWLAGQHPADYPEPFAEFAARVTDSLGRAAAGNGTVLVVTSGGPLSVVVSRLLAGDDSLWTRLNPVQVNTGVTKVLSSARGMTCVSVNGHEHLEHERELLTYR